jgi:ABC-type lipoprotein export system ATPase subunit
LDKISGMVIQLNQVVPHALHLPSAESKQGVWRSQQHFSQGEKVFLQANSGKGKSTFIHIIYGLRKDYAGEVLLNGKDIATITAEEWAKIRQAQLSVVFQDLKLLLDITGEENLQLKQALTNTISMQQALDWCEHLGITKAKLQQKVNTLSYGERQRIAIVRSLLQPFEFLLLDEPFSHLDQYHAKKASQLIAQEIERNNAGMLWVDLDESDVLPYTQKMNL